MKLLKFSISFGVVLLSMLSANSSKAQATQKGQLSIILDDSTITLNLTNAQRSKLSGIESDYQTGKTAIENGDSPNTIASLDSTEVTLWLSVLQPKQIVQLKKILNKANKERGLVSAKKAWLQAEKDSIVADFGKDSCIQQMTAYFANKFTVHTLLYNNRRLCDSADKVVSATRPRLLSALDDQAGKWGDMAGVLGSVWKHRAEVHLTKQQEAAVIAKGKEELRQEKLAHERPDSFSFNRASFEAGIIPTILSDSQYTAVLRIRNLAAAQKKANYAWRELTNKGLIAGLNKDTTLNQATEYYLNILVVTSKLIDQPDVLKKTLHDLSATLPEALLLLKHTNDTAKGKPSSGTYSW